MTDQNITGNFISPCLECGATVHTFQGERQPHDCQPVQDRREAIARAYWAGHDTGWSRGEYFGANK